MNTAEIDKIVYDMTTSMGGIPAPLNYEGYPYSVCTSVNEQVCHGFPSEKVILKEGDIINVDCSTILNGYFSDSSRMFCIGEVSPEKKKLVQVTKECVELGLKEVKPWGFLGDMGQAVHDHAYANGYTVVREIGGHGVGLEFHEEPWVGYNSRRGTQMVLAPGMIFTIEPMVNMGGVEIFIDEENDWEDAIGKQFLPERRVFTYPDRILSWNHIIIEILSPPRMEYRCGLFQPQLPAYAKSFFLFS